MGLNIYSKETQLLIKLLGEFRDGPNNLSSLVQAIKDKRYCKSRATAYRYASRVLTIKKIFKAKDAENLGGTSSNSNSTVTPEQARKEFEEMERQGIPFFLAIDAAIHDPRLSRIEKRRFCESRLEMLSDLIAKHIDLETIPSGSDSDTYRKLQEHGLV